MIFVLISGPGHSIDPVDWTGANDKILSYCHRWYHSFDNQVLIFAASAWIFVLNSVQIKAIFFGETFNLQCDNHDLFSVADDDFASSVEHRKSRHCHPSSPGGVIGQVASDSWRVQPLWIKMISENISTAVTRWIENLNVSIWLFDAATIFQAEKIAHFFQLKYPMQWYEMFQVI